MSERHAQGRQM